jgi:glycosyltransferase 2 family protein
LPGRARTVIRAVIKPTEFAGQRSPMKLLNDEAGQLPAARPGADPTPSAVRRKRSYAWLGTLISLLLFGASIAVLYRILSDVKVDDVRAAFANASQHQLALAAGFTALSYLLLTLYDMLALRQLKIRVPYRTTALASFTSYAVSFMLGFPLITAGTVRYWIYSPRGLSAGKVASLTLIAGVTFLLGLGAVIGVGLIWQAEAISELNHLAVSINRLIGMCTLGVIIVYLVWVGVKKRAVRMNKWRLELPNFSVSLGQILLGAGDVCAASAVLYSVLPAGYDVPFQTFAAVYAFACVLGIASHAPGGLGVFEATMLLAFWRLPYEGMIGALLLFRICYYLVPFCLALVLLGLFEITSRIAAYRARVEREEREEATESSE